LVLTDRTVFGVTQLASVVLFSQKGNLFSSNKSSFLTQEIQGRYEFKYRLLGTQASKI